MQDQSNLEKISAEEYKMISPETKKLIKTLEQKRLTDAEINAVIDQVKNPQTKHRTFKHYWSKNHVKIGLVSDLHFGSKYRNQETLNDLYKRFKTAGVQAVYIAGDITEGYNMRPGHSFECDLHGADEQAEAVIKRLPKIGKPQYFILGDHDHSHYKRQGVDIGKHIEREREDLHYLGFFNARIMLTPKTSIDLVHPAKGTAYAVSYQVQKLAEALSGGEKPNIMAVGHYHKIEYLFYRNIHIFQTGCMQDQTGWMKRMNLSAHKAGWILDVYFKKDGTIDRLDQTLIPYYK